MGKQSQCQFPTTGFRASAAMAERSARQELPDAG